MTWTRETVRSELVALLEQHSDDGVTITDASHLVGDLGIDSLGVMEIIAEVEDKFGLHIPDEALHELETVDDVTTAIVTRLEGDGRLTG